MQNAEKCEMFVNLVHIFKKYVTIGLVNCGLIYSFANFPQKSASENNKNQRVVVYV